MEKTAKNTLCITKCYLDITTTYPFLIVMYLSFSVFTALIISSIALMSPIAFLFHVDHFKRVISIFSKALSIYKFSFS